MRLLSIIEKKINYYFKKKKMVIDISKKFLPEMTKGFNDSRVKIHLGDGCAFLKEKKGEFDVIIVDSSDPIGLIIFFKKK